MFFRNKIEDSVLKLFGSKLWALSGAERRLLDAVLIHKHRASVSPRVILALAACCTVSSRQTARFIVRADENLTAFLELERAIWPSPFE
jgi:hypothetical protein